MHPCTSRPVVKLLPSLEGCSPHQPCGIIPFPPSESSSSPISSKMFPTDPCRMNQAPFPCSAAAVHPVPPESRGQSSPFVLTSALQSALYRVGSYYTSIIFHNKILLLNESIWLSLYVYWCWNVLLSLFVFALLRRIFSLSWWDSDAHGGCHGLWGPPVPASLAPVIRRLRLTVVH